MPAPKKPKATFNTNWQPHTASASAVEKFESAFAKKLGMNIATSDVISPYEVIPSGSLALDDATRIGGYPVGRVVELWGPEHAGKTLLTILAAIQAQRTQPDKMVGLVDQEQTFNKGWAQRLGLNLKRLWLPPVKTAEETADATKELVMSGLCSIVAIDSIGSMITKAQFEKDSEEATVASVAKVVTRMVQQVSAIGAANGTTTFVINQVRANIAKYGPVNIRPGGFALGHASSMRLHVRRGSSDPKTVRSDGVEIPVGYEMVVKVEKNKMAPYGSVANMWFFNQPTTRWGPVGVDVADEAVNFGVDLEVIERKGAWYTTPAGDRFNGRETLLEHLRENVDLVEQIRTKVVLTNASGVSEDLVESTGVDLSDLAT